MRRTVTCITPEVRQHVPAELCRWIKRCV